MAVLADRPERCSINSILQHNGSTTKRWRYAGSINQDKFPSCPTCFKKRITNINTYVYNRCHNCCDWNYNATNMHMFNEKGEIVKMYSAEEILWNFYKIRMEYNVKRKKYLEIVRKDIIKDSNGFCNNV